MAVNQPTGAPAPVMHTAEAQPAIADPAPLGLAGFGLTTMLLMFIDNGVIGAGATAMVLPVAAFYGGLAQLLAGMWAFKRGNTFAATAFSSYGAFWLTYFLLVQVILPSLPKADASTISPFVGLYLFMWGVFTAYMFIASLAGTRAVQAVFLLLAATYIILAFANWSGNQGILHLGGWVGVLTAVAALYTSFADVTNASFKRVILPTNF